MQMSKIREAYHRLQSQKPEPGRKLELQHDQEFLNFESVEEDISTLVENYQKTGPMVFKLNL